ncbi:RiPP maturation radical SAM C-methyltransferase [Paracoccus salsus]|uniref:RiPP maturation radical SAM C-methyltransferase n=1 Tax=Paracoccus salsus TaxID=2911061 RepID=UPI001EFF8EE4|nr:RiPP maturation radical SAM C-methyltransferase [Paracoccus salsus]MCF3974288.1 RiPP maturation radical SAM C-methyltransferase [Paracoccus salsus]
MHVVFPVVPFADIGRPAMGVGLLIAEARESGHTAEALYVNIDLASAVGLVPYQRIATSFPPNLLIGEWIIASDLFGEDIAAPQDYFADILQPYLGEDRDLFAAIMQIRQILPDYLNRCADEIMALQPDVVGFSTVFHQTCACLALARRLKERENAPVIVFGGANCEGEMGLQLIRSFPWIDHLCSGEADISFPALLNWLGRGGEGSPPPGVLSQGAAELPIRSRGVTAMDKLPYPDFDDYFARLADSALAGAFEGHLVFETSRGCWWGAKHHCTFCGLNGDTMAFRSKSPERAFDEIAWLTDRHKTRRIGCVDNILDMKYLTTLFPRLAAAGFELDLFYEVKSNLRLEQLRQMRAGGVTQIQPGIESFSDHVLKLMDKGCTGFQNIQLMRWCSELGIEVSWNVLAGFPGEDPAEYAAMAALMPRLTHLDPPCSCGMLRLDRFSPFHSRAAEMGIRRMRPARAYFYVYPLGRRELSRLAYFFDFDHQDGRDPQDYLHPVQAEVAAWKAAQMDPSNAPRLDARFDADGVTIRDSRPMARRAVHRLEGLAARLYALCDSTASLAGLAHATGLDPDAIESQLAALDADGLVARQGDRVLALAVFRTRPHTLTPESHAVSEPSFA